jgi:hypothetical protein
MYSHGHLVVSVAVALAVLAVAPPTVLGLPAALLVPYAAVVGVGIDLDHFPIAWYNTGEPRALRAVLADPRLLLRQGAIFRPGEVTSHERLLTHTVIAGIATPATWVLAPPLGLTTGLVLYAHVLTDLGWRVYRERTGVVDRSP